MANYSRKFVVKPGSHVKLKDFPTDWTGKFGSEEEARDETEQYRRKMDDLQNLMYSEGRHSLLIVLQGLDAAGKDGVIRHVLTGMNPQGVHVSAFKEPTKEELSHDFLWRIHGHAPGKGMVAVFNRSHYEDVLIVRVHKQISEKRCERRYELINDFERLLRDESNTTVLKFFLHISKDEQLERFRQRLEDPLRNWKIAESDYIERERWDDYTEAYERLLRKTSTKDSPWFVIPSDHKWFRNLAISQIITQAMDDMKMKLPKPSVDLQKIRRKYARA